MRSLEGDGRGIPAPEAAAGAGLGSFASDGRGSLSWNPRLGVLVALVSECGGPFPFNFVLVLLSVFWHRWIFLERGPPRYRQRQVVHLLNSGQMVLVRSSAGLQWYPHLQYEADKLHCKGLDCVVFISILEPLWVFFFTLI